MNAATKQGELSTKEQVAAHVRRMLDDPKVDKARQLKFFREYFEYDQAANVFKDKPKTFAHEPSWYVSDTDRLILTILAADKDVFRELLTTDKSFVNFSTAKSNQTRIDEPKPGAIIPPKRDSAAESRRRKRARPNCWRARIHARVPIGPRSTRPLLPCAVQDVYR